MRFTHDKDDHHKRRGRGFLWSLVLLCALWAHSGLAALAYFVQWQPFPESELRLLLPVQEGRSPSEMAVNYLAALRQHPRRFLGMMLEEPRFDFQTAPAAFTKTADLRTAFGEPGCAPHMLVVANRFGHMRPDDPFPHVRNKLASFGAQVHTLPLALGLVLDPGEMAELRAYIVKAYHGLVAIGGSDIHPTLYSGPMQASSFVFKEVDEDELALLRFWLAHGRGALFGICRGHQLIAVLLGCQLVQELEGGSCPPQAVRHYVADVALAEQATSFRSAWHELYLCDRDNALFQAVGHTRFPVNSRHHQGILMQDAALQQEDARARVIAYNGDVVEALELKDERGFTVQFHPEDMNTCQGDLVMKEMVRQARCVKERLSH